MKPDQTGWTQFISMMRGAVPPAWVFAVAFLLSILEAAGGLIVPIFTRDLIDRFAAGGIELGMVLWLAAAFIIQAAAGGFSQYMMTYIGETFVRNIRQRLWNHVLKLRVPFFDKHESGELISRVTQDTNTVKILVTNHLVSSVSGIISIIGALAILLVIDWKMTVIMLSAVPISMLILLPLGRLVYRLSMQMQDELASFSASLGRVLSDIRLVKSHNAQAFESMQGAEKIHNLFRFGMKEARIQAFVSPVMTSVLLATLVVLIGYGGARVAAGDLSAGTMVAIIIYMFQIVMPFSMLAQFFTAFQKAMGATERIQELLGTETEEDDPARAGQGRLDAGQSAAEGRIASSASALLSITEPDRSMPTEPEWSVSPSARKRCAAAAPDRTSSKAQGRTGAAASERSDPAEGTAAPTSVNWHQTLSFRDVSFSYNGKDDVLNDIRIDIKPGSTVAFVGPSGSGKTTIFSLLERFYEPTKGSIMLGDVPIQHIPLFMWRDGIGYVPQESPVMSGTIRSNLTYGLNRRVTDEQIAEAARLANAASFIEAMPDRYDTEVGERGIKLSGGQRQRIAIARALLRDPKLLLLDEATSNLDSESEALVQEALENLMRGRTTLIIAHRLSTVIGADHIVFLDKGVITGQGTHEQLMEQHALYRRFVQQQMSRNGTQPASRTGS